MFHSTPNDCPRTSRLVFVGALITAVLTAGPALAEAVAKQVSGSVEIGHGEPPDWRALRAGEPIAPNDRVRTGADGRVEIATDAGTFRVHENSVLRLPSPAADADRVDLERGHSLFDVLRRGGRRFEVHTPTVVVSVKGTRFGVDARGELGQVAVYHGVVGVREVGSDVAYETLVREGFIATGGAGQPIELDLAPPGDPWEGWQDFRRELRKRRERRARIDDVSRARGMLHRATNEAVLRRAAERRPEVAERLETLRGERARLRDAKAEAATGMPSAEALPASPRLPLRPMSGDDRSEGAETGDPAIQEMLRLDREGTSDETRRRQEALVQDQMRQKLIRMRMAREFQEMTNGTPLASGNQDLSLDDLQGQVLLDVVSARNEVFTSFMEEVSTNPGTTWDESQFTADMEQALISRGYDPTAASTIVSNLLD